MTLREWFRIDKRQQQELPVRDFEARLPGQPAGTGSLDPRSPSWVFVRDWATEALLKARERNDNANRDIIQTSMLRGEIKVLKELINLPNPKTVRGLLEEE